MFERTGIVLTKQLAPFSVAQADEFQEGLALHQTTKGFPKRNYNGSVK